MSAATNIGLRINPIATELVISPDQRPENKRGIFVLGGLFAVWAIVVLGGIGWLSVYAITPGPAAVARAQLPAGTGLPTAIGEPTLVMIVHPSCPCSRASIAELNALSEDCGSALSIDVLFVPPEGFRGDVKSCDLWSRAAAISKANLIVDQHGQLARQFGAATSGQVFLYDAKRALQFQGGITASRGHAGDNVGRDAIETIVQGEVPVTRKTAAFGCALY